MDIIKVYNSNNIEQGFVLLVYGNDQDVVSDHSGNEVITNIVDSVLATLGVL